MILNESKNMNRAIMTVVTADYYQYYIPIFIWSILNTWNDVDIIIYLRGELSNRAKDAMCVLNLVRNGNSSFKIVQHYKPDYPYMIGTTNALRFTTEPLTGYDEVLVTDIDFFFTEMPIDIFAWYRDNKQCEYFSGTHGPFYKPPRPEICKSWNGRFQRVAGGFFVAYKPWWESDDIDTLRKMWDVNLKNGDWGHFRESDEVLLYRMIRDAGLPIPEKVPFPRFLRHLHFGDFKPEMRTRFENENKMRSLLDPRVVNAFLRSKSDKTFSKILDIIRENSKMKEIIDRTVKYCEDSRK